MYKLPDGQVISRNQPFTLNGMQYISGIAKMAEWELPVLGIVEIPDAVAERYDDRFYFAAGIPKDLVQLKNGQISQIKQTAASLISKYDYQTVREMQGGKPMSAEIKKFCAAVRTYSNKVEDEVNALKTVPALEKWAALPFEWPVDPNAPAML